MCMENQTYETDSVRINLLELSPFFQWLQASIKGFYGAQASQHPSSLGMHLVLAGSHPL